MRTVNGEPVNLQGAILNPRGTLLFEIKRVRTFEQSRQRIVPVLETVVVELVLVRVSHQRALLAIDRYLIYRLVVVSSNGCIIYE